jgi:hypothetical protein
MIVHPGLRRERVPTKVVVPRRERRDRYEAAQPSVLLVAHLSICSVAHGAFRAAGVAWMMHVVGCLLHGAY